jgi:hypothetical protein
MEAIASEVNMGVNAPKIDAEPANLGNQLVPLASRPLQRLSSGARSGRHPVDKRLHQHRQQTLPLVNELDRDWLGRKLFKRRKQDARAPVVAAEADLVDRHRP